MKRVLVTGAGGFIGRQCLEPLIRAGYEVHAVTRRSATVEPPGVRWVACDLLAPGAAERIIAQSKPTHLLHLAWIAAPGLYWTSPDNERWLAASRMFLERFVATGGRRAVVAGTCAEYDWSEGICRELSTPLRPVSLYGQCKLKLFEYLRGLTSPGFSAGWGRVFWTFGPHEPRTRLVPSVILSLLAGQRARCDSGALERDFLPVQEIGRGFAALLDSDATGPVNIAGGRGVAIGDLAGRIAALMGRAGEMDDLPADGDAQAPRVVADITRLSREVGFIPSGDLDAALAATIAWWRRHPDAGKSA